MHSNDQNGRIQRILTIKGKFFKRLHHLSLLHDNQLPFCKHRISSCRCYYLICIYISTITHSLVEVSLTFIKTIIKNGITDHIDIIRFITHKKINRLEDTATGIFDYIPAEGVYFNKTFSHNLANIQRILDKLEPEPIKEESIKKEPQN